MNAAPLVSVIIIFLDEERFLPEAVQSVRGQTFDRWELILVDDGSRDRSGAIGRKLAADDPHRIRYVRHDDGGNHGMSASRNLGLSLARGRYVAFLDGDDIWLPIKLERQTALLAQHRAAAMVFAPLLRWRRWTGEPDAADLEDLMGVGRRKFGSHPLAHRLVDPPGLLRLMLPDDYFIPGGALIRRDVLTSVGGYEESFRTSYEDAVVMMKIAAQFPVFVDDKVVYLYRMHPESCTAVESSSELIDTKRTAYLDFTDDHLRRLGLLTADLDRALRRARRSTHDQRLWANRALAGARSLGRRTMPRMVRDEMRRWWRLRTRPDVVP